MTERAGNTPLLEEFAERSYDQPSGANFSYARNFGQIRFVMLDSRCARLLNPGRRAMMDDAGWTWFADQVTGQYQHLVIGTSLPYFLPAGLHYLEAWNEAICDGTWGERAAGAGEKLRQGLDLEHWAAFRRSFEAVTHLLIDLVAGRHRWSPCSIGFLSGDVPYAYLARASLPAGATGSATAVYQVVCSPIRNPLSPSLRVLNACASVVGAGLIGRDLAKAARVPRAPFDWTVSAGPYFHNVLSAVEIDGERVDVRWLAPSISTDDPPPLREIADQRIHR